MTITAVILAAGQGTRMRSKLPKMLHPLMGRSLIQYSLDAAGTVTDQIPVVVVGHGAEQVRDAVGDAARFAIQDRQLGTANAVQAAEDLLVGQSDLILVTYADMPLFRVETLKNLAAAQRKNNGPLTMLTVNADDPRGFGRIIRNEQNDVVAIVEEAQATPDQLEIHELNASAYCFDADWLWNALHRVPLSPKGEYYLTDTVEIAVNEGYKIQAFTTDDPTEALGINNRVHLAEAEAILRERINRAWMEAGVTIIDPATTYIQKDVVIGQDTEIWPNTYLRGSTRVGEDCIIGPNSILEDMQVGNHCKILSSVLEKSILEDHVDIGPFGHLRKGAHLAKGVHMGNFGEVKDSYLGPGTKMGHFSYIGNAQIGSEVNIGAGTITCNYDGEHKNPTEIGDNVFIGSDTMLVAPVKLGDGAHTGAGSVITHDVEPGEVVIGVPARPYKKKENDG